VSGIIIITYAHSQRIYNNDIKSPHSINVRENQRGNKEWTIQRNWQHWVHKTQDEDKQNNKTQHRDTGNIGHTRHRTKTNKTIKHNTETLATLGTQDTGRRQTKQ
jgi:hypothetical protein